MCTGSGLYYGRQNPRLAPVRVSPLLLMMVNIVYGPVPHIHGGPIFLKKRVDEIVHLSIDPCNHIDGKNQNQRT